MTRLAFAALLLSACAFDSTVDLDQMDPMDDKRDQTPEREPSDDPNPEPIPEPDPLPDPDPDPDPGPCTMADVQLLIDENFDDGGVEWIEESPYELVTDRAPLAPHSPEYVAWLGGYAFGTDRLLQPLMVPSDTITMTLEAVLARDEPLINFDDDAKLEVQIRDMDMNVLEVIESRKSGDIDDDWQSFSWDIDGYYNALPVVLVFEVDTDFDAMSILVDSVRLSATVCQ